MQPDENNTCYFFLNLYTLLINILKYLAHLKNEKRMLHIIHSSMFV